MNKYFVTSIFEIIIFQIGSFWTSVLEQLFLNKYFRTSIFEQVFSNKYFQKSIFRTSIFRTSIFRTSIFRTSIFEQVFFNYQFQASIFRTFLSTMLPMLPQALKSTCIVLGCVERQAGTSHDRRRFSLKNNLRKSNKCKKFQNREKQLEKPNDNNFKTK